MSAATTVTFRLTDSDYEALRQLLEEKGPGYFGPEFTARLLGELRTQEEGV